jgi:hypothetical protein
MLLFNPAQRWTARQCLDHPMFEDIRDAQLEFKAPFRIMVHDQLSEGFDYEDYVEKLTIEDCHASLQEELAECEKLFSK